MTWRGVAIANTRTSQRIRTATSERGGWEGGDGREEESGLRAEANDLSCTHRLCSPRSVTPLPNLSTSVAAFSRF